MMMLTSADRREDIQRCRQLGMAAHITKPVKQSALLEAIATAQGSFDSNGVFAAMIVIAVVALIAEWLLTMIEDRLLTWRPETTVNE